MLEITGFYSSNDLIGYTHHRIAGKTDHNRTLLNIVAEAWQLLCLGNNSSKFAISYITNPWPAYRTGGKNIVSVRFLRFLNTVGGHQNRTREDRKFFLLVLPGAAIVTIKMGVFI